MSNPGNTGKFHSFVDEHGRVCTGPCGQYKVWDDLANNGRKPDGAPGPKYYRNECKDCNRERIRLAQVKMRQKLREEIFAHYDNKCACCGESEAAFLTIDHVNNDGAEHRRELGKPSGTVFYFWLRKNNYPEGFQALCWNCNCGKRINKGVCPHELVRS
jgi:hypothetical protein